MPSETTSTEFQLPFAHGIEVELQLIKRDGAWIRGEEIVSIFDRLVATAKGLLDAKIRSSQVSSIRKKCKYTAQTEEGERGSRIVASYEDPNGVAKEYTLIGHDPNVTSLTWILEVATPPCTSLEELAWWIQTLVAISHDSLPKDERVILVSTGLNPTQEYLKNLSFGEHHHILSPSIDDQVKLAVYNMIRNFTPHLIALSVNSPFENKSPTDSIYIDENNHLRAPKCKRSIRLHKNTTQMGPTSQFEFIPYMDRVDKEAFAKHVNRSFARMVDVYPFTDYGTIEVRVFDTQLSVPRRIGLALLLQALALKAKKMVESGERIPDIDAESLSLNREGVVAAGLWAPFRPGSSKMNSTYMRVYNGKVNDDGTIDEKKRSRFMADAVESMLFLIREELDQLNVIDNPFMQPILVSLFGSEFIEPRFTGADFQLKVYAESDFNMVVLLKRLASITQECCTNWLYDPLEGRPNLPTWMCWWKGLDPEIIIDTDRVFAGQETEFAISLRNTTERPIANLGVSYSIEDSDRNVIDGDVVTVPSLEGGEIRVVQARFTTTPSVSAYNIIVTISIAGKSIPLTGTINTYWVKAGLRSASTTQFADGQNPLLFSGEIETNYPATTEVLANVTVIAPKRDLSLGEVKGQLTLEAGDILLFNQTDLPPLVISTEGSEGVERCFLHFRLLDSDGEEIVSKTSKPFYIGFASRGPKLHVELESFQTHIPGDLVQGEINLVGGKATEITGSELVIEFIDEKGKSHHIVRTLADELRSGPLGFQWRVPVVTSVDLKEVRGHIHARIMKQGRELVSTQSSPLRIGHHAISMQIESMRAPMRVSTRGKIRGWMRVRRSSERGDPGSMSLFLRFDESEEILLLTQSVRPSRNLSLAYGPVDIPRFKGPDIPQKASLIAVLSYAGVEQDRKSVEIQFIGATTDENVRLDFIGVPRYVIPNEVITPVVEVSNESNRLIEGKLEVTLDTVVGSRQSLNQDADLLPGEQKMISLPLRIPIGAGMSTAHLRAVLQYESHNVEKVQDLKVKALESPVFFVEYSVRDKTGEIPGFVSRVAPVEIVVRVRCTQEVEDDLIVNLRVMSKHDIVVDFHLPFTPDAAGLMETTVKWTTPPVEVVTGFYLDVKITQQERILPDRAISQEEKKFTVY